ncbi:major tail protein [Terrisporobacter hibernicus]|uniref:Phage tail protein n=1 Tax=Terrisporobacter hibernicus TaxID=2813371 RepID=A0AAX2ZKW7_9FIRM|nr:major tail protein [Terrisporobacter hibernicus]UEL48307.1 hypothetical protein JW646_02305 [Terrisporobacter hibernicus]
MAKTGQIGLSELRLAKRAGDGTVVSDSTMKVDGLVTAEVEIDMYSESFFCDDVVADVFTGFSSGTVTVELLGLSLEEYALVSGQEVVRGVVVDNVNTIAPILTMSFKSLKSNGKYRLVSIPQVKGTVKGESFQTKEDGVEVANVEIEFAIIPLENGVWRVRCDEDATGVDASFANSFLTTFPTDVPSTSVLKTRK